MTTKKEMEYGINVILESGIQGLIENHQFDKNNAYCRGLLIGKMGSAMSIYSNGEISYPEISRLISPFF